MNIKQINFINYFAIILASIVITTLNLYPNYYKKINTPNDKWFTGQASWFDPWDVNIYSSAIGYGKNGSLTYFNLYDSESGQKVPIYHIYTLIGFISEKLDLNKISNLDLFFYSTYFTNIILVITLWSFFDLFFNEKRHKWLTLLLTLIAGGFGFLLYPNIMLPDISHPEFTMLNSLTKPHRAISSALFLLSVFYFYKSYENESKRFLVFGGFSTFLLLFFHPHKILLLGILFIFLSIHKRKSYEILLAIFLSFAAYFLLVGKNLLTNISLIGLTSQNTGAMANPVFVILGFGFLFPFIILGVFLKKHDEKIKFVFFWLLSQVVLVYLPFKFQRELVQGIWIPAVILATQGIISFCKNSRINFWQFSLLIIVISSASFFLIFYARIQATTDNPWIYLTRDEAEIIDFISKNDLGDNGILAQYTISNMIPALTQNRVYVGHQYQSPDALYRLEKTASFFKGEMTVADAKIFMEKAKIKYVFFGPKEKIITNGKELPKKYLQFLKPKMQTESVVLFELK